MVKVIVGVVCTENEIEADSHLLQLIECISEMHGEQFIDFHGSLKILHCENSHVHSSSVSHISSPCDNYIDLVTVYVKISNIYKENERQTLMSQYLLETYTGT